MPITEKRKTGDLGEDIAAMFLMKQGFGIVERNYLRKWGEIDIIAKKDGKLYFVEVKTVSCGTRADVSHETPLKTIFRDIFLTGGARGFSVKEVTHETRENPKTVGFRTPPQRAGRATKKTRSEATIFSEVPVGAVSQIDGFRPEDNLHTHKLQRLRRTIQTYLAEKGIGEESDWQFDAMCVYLDQKGKYAEIECIKDIIL